MGRFVFLEDFPGGLSRRKTKRRNGFSIIHLPILTHDPSWVRGSPQPKSADLSFFYIPYVALGGHSFGKGPPGERRLSPWLIRPPGFHQILVWAVLSAAHALTEEPIDFYRGGQGPVWLYSTLNLFICRWSSVIHAAQTRTPAC
jgi:hypothetical protein